MKSDYQKLCKKYDNLVLENENLKKEIDMWEKQQIMFLKTKKENDFLKREIFEIKLLLSKKVKKYMEAFLNGGKQ